MFGIGFWEMIILGIVCLLPAVAGIIGIGILIWHALKGKPSSQENKDGQS